MTALTMLQLLLLTATVSSAAPSVLTAPLSELEREQMVQDFVDFVSFCTESSDATPPDLIPSTHSQREFAVMLSQRLPWPHVEVDELGCMHAVIPGRPGSPSVAMLAHVDTSPQVNCYLSSLVHTRTGPRALTHVHKRIMAAQFTGKGIQPIVHREWSGEPISLPIGGLTLDPNEMPALGRVARRNDTIITASGDTLLGADDK